MELMISLGPLKINGYTDSETPFHNKVLRINYNSGNAMLFAFQRNFVALLRKGSRWKREL
jgi:hypothetical protein